MYGSLQVLSILLHVSSEEPLHEYRLVTFYLGAFQSIVIAVPVLQEPEVSPILLEFEL